MQCYIFKPILLRQPAVQKATSVYVYSTQQLRLGKKHDLKLYRKKCK